MTERERLDADQLICVLQARIRAEDERVGGFNIGSNCGDVAGRTVAHAHIHPVPRRSGDTVDPRGGCEE
jgi:diadenosine tetraphosphate (Ap4A) HIT family hydrolase